jgi:endonuclease
MRQYYDLNGRALMYEWAASHLQPGQTFSKSEPKAWFAENYPKLSLNSIDREVEVMSINNPIRRHNLSVKPALWYDLFYKVGPDCFRLWNPQTDGLPIYP